MPARRSAARSGKNGGAPPAQEGLRRRTTAGTGPAARGQYLYFIHLSNSLKVGFLPDMKMPTR